MTAVSVLDDKTASAIREALTAVRTGRVDEGCSIAQSALADGGDPAALNALLGSILCSSGRTQEGIDRLHVAHSLRPSDPIITSNLATALCEIEEYAAALEVVTEAAARNDKSLRLARIRGFSAQMAGDMPAAIAAYRLVVEAAPSDWEMWNNLGNCLSDSGDFVGAVAALRQSVDLNPRAAPTRLNLCRALRDAGHTVEAEAGLRVMAEDFPEDAKPWMDLHDLFTTQGREDREILEALESAVAREPANVELLGALGRQLIGTFDMDRSEQVFRSALRIDPSNADIYMGLTMIAEYHHPESLEALASEAEAAGVAPAALNLIRAFSHRRAKRHNEGLSALRAVPEDYDPARRAQVEGQLLDSVGEYDEAFAAFTRMNELLAEDASQPLLRGTAFRELQRKNLKLTTADWIAGWAAPSLEPKRSAPVFLVGFPRSGTTLLDTMLMGHPNVVVMEERPVLARVEKEIGGFEAIADLDERGVRKAQDAYFSAAGDYVDLRDDAVLLDKSPLTLNRAALVHRMFPNARFILALRHPADVVLSCFVTGFRLNASMANFLKLDTTAEFYDLTFRAWENANALLPLTVYPIRYEQVIEDPEAVLRPVVEAIGLPWHPNMLDHQRTAEGRGVISTASYAQVIEPLYRRSAGRWRNYRKHLEPILPILQPWIEKFGYEA